MDSLTAVHYNTLSPPSLSLWPVCYCFYIHFYFNLCIFCISCFYLLISNIIIYIIITIHFLHQGILFSDMWFTVFLIPLL